MTEWTEWTVEETGLISCYWKAGGTKRELCKEIQGALLYMESEMQALAERVMKKLDRLEEEEYREFFHSAPGQ